MLPDAGGLQWVSRRAGRGQRRKRLGQALHQSIYQPPAAQPVALGAHNKQTRCVMSIIGWIILGLISGFIASKIVNKAGEGFFLDIALGVVGAIVGGFIFSAFGASGITGFNLYSMI